MGCDDTRGPHTELRPTVLTIPSDPAAARAAFPWITYEGRWGELQKAFFNGPTGPNTKTQWTAPGVWSKDWRTRSYAVPTSGVFGTSATDFFMVVVIGTTLTLLGLALVQAATVYALVHVGEGRSIGPVQAYRLALRRARPLLGGLAIAVGAVVALSATAVLIPVAAWLAVRWALLAQVVVLEESSAIAGLRRSVALVRHRWWRVASLVGVGAALALVAGPFLGALLILATEAPLPLLNVLAGVIYALAMPLVALTTSYVYFDAKVRETIAPEARPDVLPAEIELQTAAQTS